MQAESGLAGCPVLGPPLSPDLKAEGSSLGLGSSPAFGESLAKAGQLARTACGGAAKSARRGPLLGLAPPQPACSGGARGAGL